MFILYTVSVNCEKNYGTHILFFPVILQKKKKKKKNSFESII